MSAPKHYLNIHKGEDREVEVSGLRVRVCRREIEKVDGGHTLTVWNPDGDGEDTELLRFDCFRERPHYHAPSSDSKGHRGQGNPADMSWVDSTQQCLQEIRKGNSI